MDYAAVRARGRAGYGAATERKLRRKKRRTTASSHRTGYKPGRETTINNSELGTWGGGVSSKVGGSGTAVCRGIQRMKKRGRRRTLLVRKVEKSIGDHANGQRRETEEGYRALQKCGGEEVGGE